MATLTALPVEIIECIARAQDLTDLCSLRLVSRSLQRSTTRHFDHRTYSTISLDFAPKSLNRLRAISESAVLAPLVQKLRIPMRQPVMGQDVQLQRAASGALVFPLPAADLLRNLLLTKLVNCRSFQIDAHDDVGRINSNDQLTSSDSVAIIMHIISETGLAMKSLTIKQVDDLSNLGSDDPFSLSDDDSRSEDDLSSSADEDPGSENVQADSDEHENSGRLNTKRLKMSICKGSRFKAGCSTLETFKPEFRITPDQENWVLNIISNAPRLKNLALKFYESSVAFIGRLSKRKLAAKLESLKLRCMLVGLIFLTPFTDSIASTLRVLSLRRVWLLEGDSWCLMFGNMIGKFPVLEKVSISWLWDSIDTGSWMTFNELPCCQKQNTDRPKRVVGPLVQPEFDEPLELVYWEPHSEKVVGVKYEGPEIDWLFWELAEALVPYQTAIWDKDEALQEAWNRDTSDIESEE